MVDGNNDRNAELLHVFYMSGKVAQTGFDSFHVWLSGFCFWYTAVIFECAQGGNHNDGGWFESCIAALDVQELFSARVRAEACLGDGVVCQLQGKLGCTNRVAAVCDVGKWTTVHQSRGVFQSLYQVWFDGVFKQDCHRAVYFEVFGVDRLVVIGVSDQNVAQTLLEVLHIRGKAQDCHNLAGNGNLEAVLTRDTVCFSAQSDVDKAQCAVVHVHAAFEQDAALVDVQLVALLHVVVQNGTQQVVGSGDGVHIAGEVQVDVLHRNDLCIAAAGSTALDAEYRT